MEDTDLRIGIMRLAASLPVGSPQRVKLTRELSASLGTFRSEGGKKFTLQTLMFSKFLVNELGVRGAQMGEYLRDEALVPDQYLGILRDQYGAKVVGLPVERTPGIQPARGVDIQKLWDKLISEIWKDARSGGSDAGDMFVNMPLEQDDDDFDNYLQSAAGDVGQSVEYALGMQPKAGPLLDKLVLALRTGVFRSDGSERWNLRDRIQRLQEIYADAWYDGMSKGWQRIQKNPKELARLKALRESFRS